MKILCFLFLALASSQAFASEKVTVNGSVILIDGKPYATYIGKFTGVSPSESKSCRQAKNTAREMALNLCKAQSGKECREAGETQPSRWSDGAGGCMGDNGPAGNIHCEVYSYVIDRLHPTDERSPVSLIVK